MNRRTALQVAGTFFAAFAGRHQITQSSFKPTGLNLVLDDDIELAITYQRVKIVINKKELAEALLPRLPEAK